MIINKITYRIIIVLLCCLIQSSRTIAFAQQAQTRRTHAAGADSIQADSIEKSRLAARFETTPTLKVDTTKMFLVSKDSLQKAALKLRQLWKPNPKKAMWMALVIPGGGQIYNRKYWKLPLFYGGFVGCVYALKWNNMMYKDYSQAYLDIMDYDPNTKSYENMLPPRYLNSVSTDRLKTILKNRKDYYRRYRDLSVFCFIGVYLLSVVDAYVDAELSNFDISKDLALKVEPSIMSDGGYSRRQSLGVHCALKF